MSRAIIGLVIGFGLGILFLIGWGIRDGLTDGVPTAKLPPGSEAAANNAFAYAVFFGPWAVIPGMVGAIAGYGSWLARPRKATAVN